MSDNRPIITFDVLKSACKYTGRDWKDYECCNHSELAFCAEDIKYPGDLDYGYIIRSNQLCAEDICPFLTAQDIINQQEQIT